MALYIQVLKILSGKSLSIQKTLQTMDSLVYYNIPFKDIHDSLLKKWNLQNLASFTQFLETRKKLVDYMFQVCKV